jgi:hypothetical protein
MAESITTKSVINSYDYRLFIGKNIIAPGEKVVDIPPLHAKQNVYIKIKEEDFHVTLTGLKFRRKLYEPGTIEAEVAINVVKAAQPSFEEVEKLFAMRQVELTIVDTDKAKEPDNETTIAKNYYIYLINPQIVTEQSKTTMYVKLTINSYDKMMSIDKYCKAFTSKKLASEILTDECQGFGFTSDMTLIDIQNLKNLSYQSTESKTVEKIQPYLVQYNESFYDFMVRTANRCGEFFYFEDGKLTIGLPPTEKKEKISSFTSITMQGYTAGAKNDVTDYSRDSVKDDGSLGDLNYDVIETDDAGFPTDTFTLGTHYNSPLGGDEYIFPLDDNKYNKLTRELCFRTRDLEFLKTTVLRATAAVAANDGDSVISMVAKEAAKVAADSANAGIIMAKSDSDVKDAVKKSYGEAPEHYKDGKLVAFSSLDSNGWIGRDFYSKIRRKENELHKKIICIDMGTKYAPVKLGERIEVDGQEGDYIVIQINLIGDLVWTRDFRKFDPSDPSTDIYSGRQSQIIWAIPVGHEKDKDGKVDLNKEVVMPPVVPVPMIRKSGPQTAFVIDNDDKKYQGRVRIAYPWQSPKDNKRLELYAAQKSLAEEQEKIKACKAKYKELSNLKLTLQRIIDKELSKLINMSESERQAYFKALENEILNLKDEMAELDAELPQDHIMDKPGQYTEIEQADFWADYEAYQENRIKYDIKKARLEEKELLLKTLKDANYDPVQALKDVSKEMVAVTASEQEADNLIKVQDIKISSLETAVGKKEDEWNKELSKLATPWVRVATPMASQGGGTFFKPNKGDEVLVNYDSDNVERPYVVGSVFSKNHLAPGEDLDKFVKDFMQKRASIAMMSPNGQHITFNAPSDGWKFWQAFSPALKSLQTYFPALKGKDLDWGGLKDLCGGIYMGDRYGLYELSLSSHDRKIKINSPYGNVEIGAFTGINIKAPNGDIKISGKNVTIEAGSKLTLHSGKNIVDKKDMKTKFADAAKAAGNTFLDKTVGNLVNLKVIDMAIVRNVIEVFMRPIEGSLLLKSNNYVMLESGTGKVQVPLDRYAPTYQKAYKMLDKDSHKVYAKIVYYIKLIDKRANNFSDDYLKLKKEAFTKQEAFNDAMEDCWNEDQAKPDIIKAVWSIKDDAKFVKINGNQGTLIQTMNDVTEQKIRPLDHVFINGALPGNLEAVKTHLQPIFEDYGKAIVDLHKHVLSVQTLFKEEDIKAANQYLFGVKKEDADTKWIDDVFKKRFVGVGNGSLIGSALTAWTGRFGNDAPKNDFMSADYKTGGTADHHPDPFHKTLIFKRKMIAFFLLDLKNDNANKVDNVQVQEGEEAPRKFFTVCYDNNWITDDNMKDKWKDVAYLEAQAPVEAAKPTGFLGNLKALAMATGSFLLDHLKECAKPFYNKDAPYGGWAHQVWNETNGQILFSSEKGKTFEIQKGTGAIRTLDITTWTNKDTLKDTIKGIK